MKNDMLEIVTGLIEKSKKDQVNWVHANQVSQLMNGEWGPSDIVNDFAVSTPNFTINIFESSTKVNNDKLPTIRLNIHDAYGNLATHIESAVNDPDYKILEELLDLAKAYARDEESLLRTIKNDLRKTGVLGGDDDIPF